MRIQHSEIVATVTRGDGVESQHSASIVVINADKTVTHEVGSAEFDTFTRSSIKPFQALPLLTSGAADSLGITAKELALACGSHNGTDDHKLTAESILIKARNEPNNLQCGAHVPTYMRLKKIVPLGDEDRDHTRNNCSGKHAGFLALARHIGDDVSKYLDAKSQTQTLVRNALSEALECDVDQAACGVDGCSAPNYSLPIYNLAVGFLKLATAESGPLARIASAMREYPEMVSGEGRFDLALSRTFPNNIVCKVGAEAIEGIGFREPACAIVVKIHDGATRALNPVCVEALRQLGLLESVDMSHLDKFVKPQVKNHRGIITGEIVADFTLHQSASDQPVMSQRRQGN